MELVLTQREAKQKNENRWSKSNYQKHSHESNLSLDNLCYSSFLILVGLVAGSDPGEKRYDKSIDEN